MDCSPPGSSVHGILRARVLEWGAIAFSKVNVYVVLKKKKKKKVISAILWEVNPTATDKGGHILFSGVSKFIQQ